MVTTPTRTPVSIANVMGHPMHPMLITLPIGFLVATFLFDLIFWQTGTEAFATGALWLLVAGLIGAALAAVTGFIDLGVATCHRQCSSGASSAVQLLSTLSFWNERCVSLGLVLSLLFTEMVFRHRGAV